MRKEQMKKKHLFSQVRERSSVGMDRVMESGLGIHWDSHFGVVVESARDGWWKDQRLRSDGGPC